MSDDVSRLLRETVDEPSRELDGADVEGVWLTALVVHLDEQGHALGAEGASITEPTSGPEHMD